jgi:tetraacyldisaccharide 4'-kinase
LLYDTRIIRDTTLGVQVIAIGNLTVGGTGKTPVVEKFARELKNQGRNVAILSRGYRSKPPPLSRRFIDRLLLRREQTPPRIVSDGKSLLLDSESAGDEPYMLASNLKDVIVLVDKDRVKAGRYAIEKFGCDTLLARRWFSVLETARTTPGRGVDRLPATVRQSTPPPPRHSPRTHFPPRPSRGDLHYQE